MTGSVFTVGELTRAVKTSLEGTFPFVWVRGQVSNCSRPSSGHVYFSLKDEDAILNAVWFKGQQKTAEAFDPLTGEVFEDGPRPSLAQTLTNGQEVICAGRLTIYPPRGAYQLVVELAQDAGQGRLQLEFERIKASLLAKGYFDTARKRPVPRNPRRTAVVTASSGAAIHDFLRIAETRGIGGEIRIYPTLVQGNEAPALIARAIDRAASDGWAEVIAVIRGGGSLEDLWAFNTEDVAEAVFRSPIPVLAGIGHEVDVSIADLVADERAATPSHAAQLLWTSKDELAQRLDEVEAQLVRIWRYRLDRHTEALVSLTRALGWLSPASLLERRGGQAADLAGRLERAFANTLTMSETRLATLTTRLLPAMTAKTGNAEHALERLRLSLEALSPLGPLNRGYALVRDKHGTILRSATLANPGDPLELTLRDGSLAVRVETRKGKTPL